MRISASFFITFTVALCIAQATPSFSADSEVIEQAQSQLNAQAEAFRRQNVDVQLFPQEKSKIVIQQDGGSDIQASDKKFYIRGIRIEGMTLFSPDQFNFWVNEHRNKMVSLAELSELTKLITRYYGARGYFTSRAILPPQKLVDQTITVQVIEGKIDEIRVEGNKYFKPSLYADKITLPENRVFRYQNLEESLYYLNQKPDQKAKAYLVPGKVPGTSDLILKVEEKNPLHIYQEFNNRGTKLTHHSRHVTHVDHNNLSGRGDTLNASASFSEEGAFTAFAGAYTLPLPDQTTELSLSLSRAKTMLIGYLKPLEIKGESFSFSPGIKKTLLREGTLTLDVSAAMDIVDSKTLINDHKISFDRMRVLRLGPRAAFQDGMNRNFLVMDALFGIPGFLGGSRENDPNVTRENSGGEFAAYRLDAARLQVIPTWQSYLILKAGGQSTPNTLTSAQQYHAGGAVSVRGYPESDSSGDYGYTTSAEMNFPLPFVPKTWDIPFTKGKTWNQTLRLISFIDMAKVFLRERPTAETVKDRFLLGIGGGVRWTLGEDWSLQADIGFPVGDTSTDENMPQWHFSFKWNF